VDRSRKVDARPDRGRCHAKTIRTLRGGAGPHLALTRRCLREPGGRKTVAHGASRGASRGSEASRAQPRKRGVRVPWARPSSAPFRGCPRFMPFPRLTPWATVFRPPGSRRLTDRLRLKPPVPIRYSKDLFDPGSGKFQR
jgi:hypothetical protein